jgi:hypothetical protein
MEHKANIRKALKKIEKLSQVMERGMEMDFAMDGSGDCGGIIVTGWCNFFNRQLEKTLAETGVTLEEIQKVTAEWAKRQLEMGPKQIFVSMYSRRQGMYKEVDWFDTRWGNLNFTIAQSINY